MAIPVINIVEQCNAALDAEGFERYRFEEDFRPAINHAKDWIVSIFNKVFSENKLTEEHLRELIYARIWVTSIYSRIAMNEQELGHGIWSIKGVFPKIEYVGGLASNFATPTRSVLCPNATYIRSYKAAKRETFERVNINRLNPFVQGNEIEECAELQEFSYVAFGDYIGAHTGQAAPIPRFELEVFPSVPREPVCVVYLAYPPRIAEETDSLPFPETLTDMVVNKTLDYISWKQGDNTNLKGVTDADVANLVQVLT